MIIRKVKIDNVICLIINKNEDVEEVKSLEYIISVENRKEYNSETEFLITKLLLNNINVYQHIANSHTLQYDCDKILSTNDYIIVIETHDESKFELLESTIKEFMIINKEYLH